MRQVLFNQGCLKVSNWKGEKISKYSYRRSMFMVFWESQHSERKKKCERVLVKCNLAKRLRLICQQGAEELLGFFHCDLVPMTTFLIQEILFLTQKHKRSKVDKLGVLTAFKEHRQTERWEVSGRFLLFYETCRIMINLFEQRHWWCVLKERKSGGLLRGLVIQADRSENSQQAPCLAHEKKIFSSTGP